MPPVALEVVMDGLDLCMCQLVEQAGELLHPLLAVSNYRLLEGAAVNAKEAHVGGRVLTRDLLLQGPGSVCGRGGGQDKMQVHAPAMTSWHPHANISYAEDGQPEM